MTRKGIFTIGICKDFCDCAEESGYFLLDVDCVLVISMGEDGTMNGHAMNAARLYARHRTQTVVVQQPLTDIGLGKIGYVLANRSVRPMPVDMTKTDAHWTLSMVN